jgi:competence protein ComEA
MNLRLPVVAAVVAAAAGAAVLHAHHSSPPPAAFAASDPPGPHVRHRRALAPDGIVVYVAGDVVRGGIYTLPSGARAVDALRAAGGAGRDADLVAVDLAQELSDGDEVAVPSLAGGESAATPPRRRHGTHHKKHRKHRKHHRRRHAAAALADAASGSDAGLDADAASASDADAPTSVIDLNTADASELETLPGVGATLAERIVSFRELTGSFGSADDLLDVAGITQSKLDKIEPYVTVGSAPATGPP